MNYKQTKQFSEFQCVGAACINNCCHNWSITWSGEGVEKLRSAQGCSDKLMRLVHSVFLLGEDGKYSIILTDNGRCPFQLDNGLCIVQKELGEDYLSGVCAVFPRRYIAVGQSVYCSCGSSCPAVLQKLIESDNAAAVMTFDNIPDIRGKVDTLANLPEDFKVRTAIKYHRELLNFFYDIISDRHFDTEVNIVRGAVAAEKLTEAVNNGNAKNRECDGRSEK